MPPNALVGCDCERWFSDREYNILNFEFRVAVYLGAIALFLHKWKSKMKSSGRWVRAEDIQRELEGKCGTPTAKVADAMTVEMQAGLSSDGGSKLKMLISYVDNLPTGWGNKPRVLFPAGRAIKSSVDFVSVKPRVLSLYTDFCSNYQYL